MGQPLGARNMSVLVALQRWEPWSAMSCSRGGTSESSVKCFAGGCLALSFQSA